MNNKEEGSRPEKDTALKEEAKKKLISVSCQLHTQGRPDIEQHLPLRPKRTPTSNLKVPKCAASKNERNFYFRKAKKRGGGRGRQNKFGAKEGSTNAPQVATQSARFPLLTHAHKKVSSGCVLTLPLLLLLFFFSFLFILFFNENLVFADPPGATHASSSRPCLVEIDKKKNRTWEDFRFIL